MNAIALDDKRGFKTSEEQAEAKRSRQKELTHARERFKRARLEAKAYERHLRAVARQVGVIVEGLAPDGVVKAPRSLLQALHGYAELLQPWAEAVTSRMIERVGLRDEQAWKGIGVELGRHLQREVASAPTGSIMRALMTEQVALIKSLPLEAAQRVHKLTIEAAVSTGARAAEIAKEIQRSGEVTKSRAMLIARTEVSRTATALTQARAQFIGSEGYIWTTSGDSDVRASHRKMGGRFVRWDSPPTLDKLTGHAGALPNCRCFPSPVIPSEL